MRILEECIKAWPMQEMRAQIDALREAFSADKEKPFELKMSFLYGTPPDSYQPSPPMDSQYHRFQISEQQYFNQQGSQSYPLQTMTPPISAISQDSGFESPIPSSDRGVGPISDTSYTSMYSHETAPAVDEARWNPTPIFHQWNTAFSIPQAALAPPPGVTSTPTPTSYPVLPQQSGTPVSATNSNQYMPQYPSSTVVSIASAAQKPQPQQPRQQPPQPQQQSQQHASQTTPAGYPTSFVSSKQFQQSVASVFDPDGLKRRWTYADMENEPHQRMR